MCSQLITSSDKGIYNSLSSFFNDAEEEILIICPYINTELVKLLLEDTKATISIITSWKIHDIWFGSSDLDLYKFAKEESIQLYINNRIHLKSFIADWDRVVTGSANLTKNGLGVSNNYNYELNSVHVTIDATTKLYFKKILADSVLVNDKIYEEYLKAAENMPEIPMIDEPEIDASCITNDFLISSLPMSLNIHNLFKLYAANFDSDDLEAVECALHDTALYKIPLGLTKEDFISYLKKTFFNSKFIQAFLKDINNEGKYFGAVKEWVQNTCTDVPVPSRRDLTGNIQVLYKWIVELSNGKYLVDRPNYSERLYKAKL